MGGRHKIWGFGRVSALALLSSVGSMGFMVTSAQAADTAASSDDSALSDAGAITVTARHQKETVQDAPLSISAVAGETLETQHLYRLADYAAKLPNFIAVQQNTRVSGLYIRGLGGNANNDGAESGVGLIVDNVVFTHVGFSWLDFVDLDHIELVRGPQGTLLGKNTTIGAVIVTTKKPSFDPSLDLEGTYGNNNRYQLRANATGPLVANKIAYRLTFYDDRGDGWIKNAYNGQRLLDNRRWAVRGQLYYDDGGPITDRVIAEHYETNEYNNFYPPFADATQFVNGAPRTASWEYKLKNIFNYTPSYDVGHNADVNTQDRLSSLVTGVSNELNWRIGDGTFTSISAWRELKFRPLNDTDLTPFSILRAGFDVDVDQYSQELRFASSSDHFLEYQVGAFFLREDLVSNNRSIFQSDSTAWFLSPALPSALLNGVEYDQYGKEQVTSGAGFGQATLHFTKSLTLTGGVRYTSERKEASITGRTFGGTALTGPLAPYAPYRAAVVNGFGGIYQLADANTTNSWSWLINPSWKISDRTMLYASVSYGEKSGAANLAATPGKPVLIKPEKSTDYEVGVKTSFAKGKGFANLNLYWNDIKDFQTAQTDPLRPAIGSYLGNAAQVRLRGVEVDGSYQIVTGLTLSANGAFNDATYRSYTNAPAPVEYLYPGASPYVDESGMRVVGAAKWSGQVSIDYDRPINDRLGLNAYVNQTYRSATNLLSPVSAYGRQSAYGLTNAGIGIHGADNVWSALVWGKNLTNRQYFVGVGAAGPVTPFMGVLGDPRTYGITIKRTF